MTAVFVSNVFLSPGGYRQRQRYFVVQGGPWSSGNWALSGTHTSYLRHRQLPTNHCVQVCQIKQKSCPSQSWNSHSLIWIIMKVKFKHALSTYERIKIHPLFYHFYLANVSRLITEFTPMWKCITLSTLWKIKSTYLPQKPWWKKIQLLRFKE